MTIDLSLAFIVVNIKLLLKRLKSIGILEDIISLIKIWVNNRMFYVEVKGETSFLNILVSGTIQGSRYGPDLYAIYVSPLFVS